MKKWETKSGQKIIQILSGRSNVFLFPSRDKNILVDTGTKFTWPLLKKQFLILNIRKVDLLILTHSHYDHAGNAGRIKDEYKSLVIIHRDEIPYLSTGNILIPEGTNIYTRSLVYLLAKRFASYFRSDPCVCDIPVETYFDLKEFGFNAFIMHTPGHSSGSVSVIIDNEIALVGDTMTGVLKWSVFPPFADDTDQLFKSWRKLLETDCSIFIPSHGTANSRRLLQKTFDRKMKVRV